MTPRSAALYLRETFAGAPAAPPRAGAGLRDGYDVEIVDRIDAVDAARWDALAGTDAVTRSHAYLRAVERAGIEDCRYFYALVSDAAGARVAQACLYLVVTDLAQALPTALQAGVGLLRRVWPGFLRTRLLECATPLAAGSSLTLAGNADPAAVLIALERAMAGLARRERSRLLVLRDFLDDELATTDCLLARGYKRVSNLPRARIQVRWPSYEAFVAALRARYRTDLRRRLARARRSGRHVVTIDDFAAESARWARQAAAIRARTRGFKRERLTPAYYAGMGALAPRARVLLAVEHAGRHIAHGLVLFDRRHAVATFFGREPGPACGEWFMLMDAAVRVAIERGAESIELGLGSYDGKALFGAEVVPQYVYTRCTIPLLNALIRLLPDFMRRSGPPARRLFRDGQDASSPARPH